MNTTLSVRCHTEQHNQALPLDDERRRREERKPSTNLRGRHHWARASRRRSLPCAAFSAAACSFVAQAAARGGPRSRTFRAINRARSYLVEICAGPRGLAAFEYASTSSPAAAASVPHPSTRQYSTRQRHLLSVGLHRQRHRAGDAHEARALERRRLEVAPGQLWPRQSSDQWPDAISARDVGPRSSLCRLALGCAACTWGMDMVGAGC